MLNVPLPKGVANRDQVASVRTINRELKRHTIIRRILHVACREVVVDLESL
ncbi:MAG: hypothetical protein ACFFBT_16140 [Promethearchaeota archaeon]